ncbi:MAG: hypothetical protein R3E84_04665 [Pseudomonadales bacterium]
MQRKLNFHYSVTLDLFGSEISTNAANAFNAGIKGRFHETRINDDHQLHNDTYPVMQLKDGRFVTEQLPAITAINARLLDDYIADCGEVVAAWNKVIHEHGIDFALALPHRGFNRRQGLFAGQLIAPEGRLLDGAAWAAGEGRWLPSRADLEYVLSLMQPVTQAGAFAESWIAPPKKHGVGGKRVTSNTFA